MLRGKINDNRVNAYRSFRSLVKHSRENIAAYIPLREYRKAIETSRKVARARAADFRRVKDENLRRIGREPDSFNSR